MARRHIIVFHGTEWLKGRYERRRVKQDIRRGLEPAMRYASGKFWTD